jgi:molecular chaperone HtpG
LNCIRRKAGTLTIKDRGVGMTAEEVNKYINDIAFSGAEEFVNKYKDKAEAIIGHFGLGFYSSFMVAKQVEIITKAMWLAQKPPIGPAMVAQIIPSMHTTARSAVPTSSFILLTTAKSFWRRHRIQSILDKYCKFLPVSIKFGTKTHTDYAKRDDKGEKIGEDVEITEDNIVNNTDSSLDQEPSGIDNRAIQRILPRALSYELRRAVVSHTPQRRLSVQPYGNPLFP